MKKILTFTAIAMIGLFVFAGCSKKSSSSPSNSMKATIGSTAFSASNCYFGISGGALAIYGMTGSGTTVTYPNISLTIESYTAGATGTYAIQDTSLTISTWVIAALDSSATVLGAAQSGSITITSATSTLISGTFNFTCTDGTKVTGGTFTAKSN